MVLSVSWSSLSLALRFLPEAGVLRFEADLGVLAGVVVVVRGVLGVDAMGADMPPATLVAAALRSLTRRSETAR